MSVLPLWRLALCPQASCLVAISAFFSCYHYTPFLCRCQGAFRLGFGFGGSASGHSISHVPPDLRAGSLPCSHRRRRPDGSRPSLRAASVIVMISVMFGPPSSPNEHPCARRLARYTWFEGDSICRFLQCLHISLAIQTSYRNDYIVPLFLPRKLSFPFILPFRSCWSHPGLLPGEGRAC